MSVLYRTMSPLFFISHRGTELTEFFANGVLEHTGFGSFRASRQRTQSLRAGKLCLTGWLCDLPCVARSAEACGAYSRTCNSTRFGAVANVMISFEIEVTTQPS